MERKLLLLGLLRSQDMHGYEINELIDAHLGTSIQLKKPTVYKLLGSMVDDRWISYYEEKEGNYPTRRVYQLMPVGEKAFQRLLRQSLAEYKPISYLGIIGIVFLNALPGDEAAVLLRQRHREIEGLAEVLKADEQHKGGFQLMLSYHLGQLKAEMAWLEEVMNHLQHAEELSSVTDKKD